MQHPLLSFFRTIGPKLMASVKTRNSRFDFNCFHKLSKGCATFWGFGCHSRENGKMVEWTVRMIVYSEKRHLRAKSLTKIWRIRIETVYWRGGQRVPRNSVGQQWFLRHLCEKMHTKTRKRRYILKENIFTYYLVAVQFFQDKQPLLLFVIYKILALSRSSVSPYSRNTSSLYAIRNLLIH